MGTRVYVGRLPRRIDERDLEKFFKGFGRIREIILKNGYAFVEFDDVKDAEDAAYDLNGRDLMGENVLVEVARGTPRGRDRLGWRGPPPSISSSRGRRSRDRDRERRGRDREEKKPEGGYRIIVENLSSRIGVSDIKDIFRKTARVTYCEIWGSRNEAMVEFGSRSDLKAIIDKFEGEEINKRKIHIREDERSNKKRSTSRSRTRSRSVGDRKVKPGFAQKSISRSRSRSAKSRSRSGSVDSRQKVKHENGKA